MSKRQATKKKTLFLTLLAFITACSPSPVVSSSPSPLSPIISPSPKHTSTPQPSLPTPSVTPLACLSLPGEVIEGILDSTNPPQAFFLYLPPCYESQADKRYPVLYLLHGQTYTADQWIRLGAVDAANHLILSGESEPFIIVFPDDRYWNVPSGTKFGERLVNALIPYIDETYRTLPDPSHRAIGGLSRGAGWALRLGLTRPDLFRIIGLHSPVVFQGDAPHLPIWLRDLPTPPFVYMDIGDQDRELKMALWLESQFNEYGLPYEWHLYSGAHTEEYWQAHVEEYMNWYASWWNTP
ncbi:MAG TPA: alpha/beta hydrolase-fold protein [Anaerolineales bacterium]|nr:alpha/beta hydrolase-fold protein [Anaerolineales bacterium]